MKQFLIVIFLGLGAMLHAQSLQFNQVKLVTSQETVPAGKVWKVESVIFSIPATTMPLANSGSNSCSAGQYQNQAIEVDGVFTKLGGAGNSAYNGYTGYYYGTRLPIWLPAGATLSGGPCLNKISVIEFTIVP